jgi:hypothetical protein
MTIPMSEMSISAISAADGEKLVGSDIDERDKEQVIGQGKTGITLAP